MFIKSAQDFASGSGHGGWVPRAHNVDARNITYIIWGKRHLRHRMKRSSRNLLCGVRYMSAEGAKRGFWALKGRHTRNYLMLHFGVGRSNIEVQKCLFA